jgi:hypothetical protein
MAIGWADGCGSLFKKLKGKSRSRTMEGTVMYQVLKKIMVTLYPIEFFVNLLSTAMPMLVAISPKLPI